MTVRVKVSALRQGKWSEYAIRFGLGGLATVGAGIAANAFGPATGGLFLAFCASATLIEKHERQRKRKKGLRGACRGKQAAALDASGAGWGSIGLCAFAMVMWFAAKGLSFSALALASLVWLVVSVFLWRLRRVFRKT
ncbi:MAG: hypothetical protein KGI99_08350 [Bradyrhizobium sp.]|uniref:hypothetical protein n=1 Tax=Bradyrhizobium sp. TaxID=376 RepID=UPI001C2A3399|nr:hypothetical protein [Bradyrhizobium sp.]MBU6462593.1 hypothetical protein [Pseudomonadota bacterium]MDE2067214.1 hypothetical protein [Bradyrhizobium sp.]